MAARETERERDQAFADFREHVNAYVKLRRTVEEAVPAIERQERRVHDARQRLNVRPRARRGVHPVDADALAVTITFLRGVAPDIGEQRLRGRGRARGRRASTRRDAGHQTGHASQKISPRDGLRHVMLSSHVNCSSCVKSRPRRHGS